MCWINFINCWKSWCVEFIVVEKISMWGEFFMGLGDLMRFVSVIFVE